MSAYSYLEQLKEARAYIARLELELEGYQRQMSAINDLYLGAPDQVVRELINISARSQKDSDGLGDDFGLEIGARFHTRWQAREAEQEITSTEASDALVDDLQVDLLSARRYIQQLTFENEGLRRQILEAGERNGALESEKSALEQDIAYLEASQGEIIAEKVELESALNSATLDLRDANGEVDRLALRVTELQAQMLAQ